MARKLPRVIHINILGYTIRGGSKELVEPYKIMYTKGQREVAIPHFSGYNIQLPIVPEMEPDFESGLYAWCYTLHTAHTEKKSAKEVVTMTPALQDYFDQKPGFAQFCERHELVACDPLARKSYLAWVLDVMKYQGQLEAAEEIGYIKGIEKVAQAMLKRKRPLHEISADTGLPMAELEKLSETKE